jgi:HD-GYP domain-containing protein (c-di-GMP phosphodiesterase class II)
MIDGWIHALEIHDEGLVAHSRRVAEVAVQIGQSMGLKDHELVDLKRGTLLHDIGKIGVPDSILNKPAPLDDAEWEVMRRHPSYARDLLSPLGFLGAARDVPYCHHEHWNGCGYPRGLAREQIPLSARICAAVDVWDALLSDRPYRRAFCEAYVREHLGGLAGNQLDPAVVATLLATIDPRARG